MKPFKLFLLLLGLSIPGLTTPARAEVGNPQIRTDHPWYPGELAISTFERLFETQAACYRRVTGRSVQTDQDKALAAWLWRNTHYWHGEAGRRDLWGEGFREGSDTRLREYWNGLFAYGFGLCGTTHSQWTAEFEHLLGHARGRGVGAAGHNAFEVFLAGDDYGEGRWALLDHDLSTVVFDPTGRRLLGLGEMQDNVDRWIDRSFHPEKQQGWLVCGLHPDDGVSYRQYSVAEYLAGYDGPPPMVHLRRGERMRRYFSPGLQDGKTFVFWGRNANTDSIPGPERSRTWVNQPDQMYGSVSGTDHRNGQARYANVQYVYQPDFASGDYREALVRESGDEVVFGFQTPYVIAATPPNASPWGIYDDGCRNGLVIRGHLDSPVAVSVDAGNRWSPAQMVGDQLDLTDWVKGHSQYWLRIGTGADDLEGAQLQIETVCQANVAVLPRLKDGGTEVTYEANSTAVVSFGPEADLAQAFLSDGGFGQSTVTLSVAADRPVVGVYAAAHVASGNPPSPEVRYQIECSVDDGRHWTPIVSDWKIPRRGDEPGDFWSQSFCYGTLDIEASPNQPVRIRFKNDGGKRYLRAEAHLVVQTGTPDPMEVTYDWIDSGGEHQQSHVFRDPVSGPQAAWHLPTARDVRTRWVQFQPVSSSR
ncbi:hypothetical protein FYK55_25805 [Roseiconus nitratireducens]|uniref:BNR repeat protein n=1 Tax=Roseiconus nitratireducens TaxID=2605748 RepID=A0A5M6CVE5_9BACT|nr:hypothetical protein [Roseiconus nitratireducens]KAA5539013.1 hypothetical protein FYK55_25805 [Roseiconus nitratireducens]